jgi:uncharacterized membrane protein YdbT with pleckstrin-like domain
MTVDEWLVRGPDEEVLWSGRPRVMPTISLALVAIAAVVLLTWFVFDVSRGLTTLLALVGVTIGAMLILRVVCTKFVVTDQACYRKTGVFSRHVRRVALHRIQDVSYRQGITGTLFGYGTIQVSVAGGWGVRFSHIDEPREVQSLINRRVVEDSDLPGTTEQWVAIRDEIRMLRSAIELRDRTVTDTWGRKE